MRSGLVSLSSLTTIRCTLRLHFFLVSTCFVQSLNPRLISLSERGNHEDISIWWTSNQKGSVETKVGSEETNKVNKYVGRWTGSLLQSTISFSEDRFFLSQDALLRPFSVLFYGGNSHRTRVTQGSHQGSLDTIFPGVRIPGGRYWVEKDWRGRSKGWWGEFMGNEVGTTGWMNITFIIWFDKVNGPYWEKW